MKTKTKEAMPLFPAESLFQGFQRYEKNKGIIKHLVKENEDTRAKAIDRIFPEMRGGFVSNSGQLVASVETRITPTLKRELLLELGVSQEILDRATVNTVAQILRIH